MGKPHINLHTRLQQWVNSTPLPHGIKAVLPSHRGAGHSNHSLVKCKFPLRKTRLGGVGRGCGQLYIPQMTTTTFHLYMFTQNITTSSTTCRVYASFSENWVGFCDYFQTNRAWHKQCHGNSKAQVKGVCVVGRSVVSAWLPCWGGSLLEPSWSAVRKSRLLGEEQRPLRASS